MAGCLVWILAVSAALCCASSSIVLTNDQVMGLNISAPSHATSPAGHQAIRYPKTQGEEILKCEATGNPRPTYYWRWDGNKILSTDTRFQQFTDNGTLIITEFSEQLKGTFQCVAQNEHGVSLSQIIELRKRVQPIFTNNPRLRLVQVPEGTGAKLDCYDQPQADPPGVYSWYKVEKNNQYQIPIHTSDNMDIDSDGNLYIINAEMSDKGDAYACAMTSGEMDTIMIAKTPYMGLQVEPNDVTQWKPTMLGASHSELTADLGGDVTLECFFDGLPTPSVTWWNGNSNTLITSGEGRMTISKKKHKLTIDQLTDNDEGCYKCQASNSMGDAVNIICLNVTSRPLFTTTSPQILVASEGSDAKFSCLAKGAFDEPNLSPPVWTMNGESVDIADRISLNADQTELVMASVTKADMACVQCTVTNSVGYAFGDGYLLVVDALEFLRQPNNFIEIDLSTREVNLSIEVRTDPCCPVLFAWFFESQHLDKTALLEPPYTYFQGNNRATLNIQLQGSGDLDAKNLTGEYRVELWNTVYSKRSISVEISMKKPEVQKVVVAAESNLWWLGIVGGCVVLLIAVIVIIIMIRFNYPRQDYLVDKAEKKYKLNPEQDLLDQSFEEL